METEFDRKVASLLHKDPRYSSDAYYFVAEAVNFTVDKHQRHGHVSAVELLDGIREFATRKYGVVAGNVLNFWGMKYEADAGNVVFLLIGAGLLRASEDDPPEDFTTGSELFPALKKVQAVREKDDGLPFFDR